ncbi:MAG: hypothetical protein PGN29_12730 [Gordonia paraffinivorans]
MPATYSCLDTVPARAIVIAGWTAPSATGVRVMLDGQPLASGLNNPLPYQVPAGGPTGIGATVAFACSGPRTHIITVEWTATGLNPATRSATITQESTNG